MTVVEEAISWAKRGYHVFPVKDKLPILKGWPDKATTNEETICEWYEGFAKYADGFGVCPKDTCLVIDVDVKNGKEGTASLKYLIEEFDLPRKTQIIRTTSGGLHLYYKYPHIPEGSHIKSISNWKVRGAALDGIDIRGNRGQVVAPTEQNGYTVIRTCNLDELAELPQALIDQLPVDVIGGRRTGQSAQSLVVYDEPSLKGDIPDVIREGERHQTLLSLTASWSRKVSYDQAKILLQEAINRCEGDIQFEDYLERLDDAYDKFEPVVEDKLQWMLDNLVYVSSSHSVFRLDKPGNVAEMDMTAAMTFYKNMVTWEESVSANGNVKTTSRETFKEWLRHPDRQVVYAVGYKPVPAKMYDCEVLGDRVVNSFRQTDITSDKEGQVQWFIDLVKFLWQDQAEIALNYFSHIIQRPTHKVHWAPLLITTFEGMGKNMFFDIMRRILGKWNTGIVNADLFTKSFNSFLLNNQLVLINEVQEVSKRERQVMVSKLKSYITESAQTIEIKNRPTFTTEIYTNFALFSNKIDSLDIEQSSRRFHVHINEDKPKSTEWYDWIASMSTDENLAAVRSYFEDRDISGFKHTGYAPDTASKRAVVEANMSEHELLIRQHIDLEHSIFVSDIVTDESWQYYIKYVLHKGRQMSPQHEKYLKRLLLERVKSHNRPRQLSGMPLVSPLSDESVILPIYQHKLPPHKKKRILAYSCRNHTMYSTEEPVELEVIKSEYMKIFDTSDSSNVSKLG